MRRKKTLFVCLSVLLCVVLLCIYFFMTPIGALRLAIIRSGNPFEAFGFSVMEEAYHDHAENETTRAYSLINPPYEAVTDSELVNWIVTSKGPFYWGSYYGWG